MALTGLIHRAYAPLAAIGLHYWGTHQSVESTAVRCAQGETWVVQQDGAVVATVTLQAADRTGGAPFYDRADTAKFGQFCVEPSAQGSGIGRLLMDRVEARARETGARCLGLDTSEQAHGLIALYERRGYRFVEFMDWRPKVNYRSVCLALDLAGVSVRRLGPGDADAFARIRAVALESAPLAFGSSLEDDRFRSQQFVLSMLGNHPEQATYGAFDGGALVGIAGVMREAKVKARHRADVWGMFTSSEARGRGVGRALLDAVVARARGWDLEQLHLGVTSEARVARRLYERAGFVAWGVDRRALSWRETLADEEHMVLDLRKKGPPWPS